MRKKEQTSSTVVNSVNNFLFIQQPTAIKTYYSQDIHYYDLNSLEKQRDNNNDITIHYYYLFISPLLYDDEMMRKVDCIRTTHPI